MTEVVRGRIDNEHIVQKCKYNKRRTKGGDLTFIVLPSFDNKRRHNGPGSYYRS